MIDMRGYKETLNGTASVQRYLKSRDELPSYPEPDHSWIVPDTPERDELKSSIFRKHSFMFIGLIVLGYLSLLPMQSDLAICLGLKLGLDIVALMSLSYLLTVRWAWDSRIWFPALTMGGVPARLGIGLALASIVLSSPEVHHQFFVYGMMVWWAVFTAVEISLVLEYCRKVKWIKPKGA